MLEKNTFRLITLLGSALFFTACTSTTTPTPQPAPVEVIQPKPVTAAPVKPVEHKEPSIDLSQKSTTFHSGMDDGCSTAKGKYKKNSASFSSDADYKEGWFYGRRKCQAHLAG